MIRWIFLLYTNKEKNEFGETVGETKRYKTKQIDEGRVKKSEKRHRLAYQKLLKIYYCSLPGMW